jgi:hypothetical protein
MMLTCLWNRHLWNEGTIQAIMDRPQPAPVVVEIEEMQDGGQLSISNNCTINCNY